MAKSPLGLFAGRVLKSKRKDNVGLSLLTKEEIGLIKNQTHLQVHHKQEELF